MSLLGRIACTQSIDAPRCRVVCVRLCVCLLVTNLHVLKRLNQQCRLGCGLRWAHKLVPLPFLTVLISWYSKCFAYVRWGSFVSSTFQIFAGVRQGGVLPSHFMLYLLIQLLVNYGLQVLVLALASFSSVVCFMLTIYCLSLTHCMICKLCLISVRRKLQI